MSDNYYSVDVHCSNCGKRQTLTVPKGVRITSYLDRREVKLNTICALCGCRVFNV